MLRILELDEAMQVGSQQNEQRCTITSLLDLLATLLLMQPRTSLAFWIARSSSVSNPPKPEVLLPRAALNPFCICALLISVLGIAPTQVHDLPLGFVGLHELSPSVQTPEPTCRTLVSEQKTQLCMLS